MPMSAAENKVLAFNVVFILAADKNRDNSDLRNVLDSVVKEVDSFYNRDKPRLSINIENRYSREMSTQRFVDGVRGKFRGVYDQWELAKQARRTIGGPKKDEVLIIITDLEITPPEGWRYILWTMIEENAVISLAAMNPEYWGSSGRSFLATVKHRTRSACLKVIGSYVDLNACENSRCFMYNKVDSVTRLDEMVLLGVEHRLEALTNMGFSPRPSYPLEVQEIIDTTDFEPRGKP